MWQWLIAILLSTWTLGCASLPNNIERIASQAFAAPEQTALGRLVAERRAGEHARSDSGFLLLDTVDAAFASRLALVDSAQRTLDLQYYAIHADSTTEVLLQHLRDAAKRGVRVRILMDDFNTVGADAQVLRLAFEPNVDIRLFNPLAGSRRSLVGRLVTSFLDTTRIQKRMHNKLFIADNSLGITGGRNLGDAYFGGDGKSFFVDLEVLAAGRVVRDMSASFDRYWNDELAYPVRSLLSPEDLEALRKPATEALQDASGPQVKQVAAAPLPTPSSTVLPNATPTAVANAEKPPMDLRRAELVWAPAALMADEPGKIGPGDDEADAGDTVVDGLLSLIQQAKSDVLIISAYFVPGKEMMDLFGQLRARGVRVRILTNSLASNDAPAAHAGYVRYRKPLLAQGIELYEMHSGPETDSSGSRLGSGGASGGSKSGASRASLHTKAVIIDGRIAVIGSMNLDLRSQRKNSEVALVIRSPVISRQATRHVEGTLSHDAYRVQMAEGRLVWRAPPGAPFKDAHSEPEASAKLKLLVQLIGPFAPEEML